MTGDWSAHHGTLTERKHYGDPTTYLLAAWWMHDGRCQVVEDWGCGGGGLFRYVVPETDDVVHAHTGYRRTQYLGVDSSASPYADVIADLTAYRARAEGIVLRHVLEHNHDWKLILDNAVASFTKRLAIVLFTPLVGETHVLHAEPDYGDRPVITFALRDLLYAFGEIIPDVVRVESPWSHFGSETLILAQRS